MTPEQHADAILRAAGLVLSINHAGYVLDFPKPASDLPSVALVSIRAAILAAVQVVRDDECARVVGWLRGCLAEHEANANRKGQITERRHHIAACTNIIAAIERGEHTAYRATTKGE